MAATLLHLHVLPEGVPVCPSPRRSHERAPTGPCPSTWSSTIRPNKATTSTVLIPTQQLGLCLLYSLPNPNGVLIPAPINAAMDFPLIETDSALSSHCQSSKTEPSASTSNDNIYRIRGRNIEMGFKDSTTEDLDLELRLGRK
ncbi:UNVERIFIED_CONTAM: hypothetical protein Sangu_1724600 [Sesamum angustifolium]|uniref:Uncharacterized protein n=1 Tax=Sesamum angustifolium TaxID=2727405 RepID=A0AAW2MMQ3_9LAMI